MLSCFELLVLSVAFAVAVAAVGVDVGVAGHLEDSYSLVPPLICLSRLLNTLRASFESNRMLV